MYIFRETERERERENFLSPIIEFAYVQKCFSMLMQCAIFFLYAIVNSKSVIVCIHHHLRALSHSSLNCSFISLAIISSSSSFSSQVVGTVCMCIFITLLHTQKWRRATHSHTIAIPKFAYSELQLDKQWQAYCVCNL